ncbi:MAG: hypothetical protein AAGF23_15905 [Acidobacteriota bacterium]
MTTTDSIRIVAGSTPKIRAAIEVCFADRLAVLVVVVPATAGKARGSTAYWLRGETIFALTKHFDTAPLFSALGGLKATTETL